MALQSGRLIGKLSSFVSAGILFAAAIGVGFIPYFDQGYQVCPSPIMGLAGGRSSSQSWYNMLSGGNCNAFNIIMFIVIAALLVLAVLALIGAVRARKRRAAGGQAGYGYPPAPYQGHDHQASQADGTPPQPGYAPANRDAGYPAPADTWSPPAGAPGSGSFDTKLALVAAAAVVGTALLSWLIDWLSFLPGIVELLLWIAVGLTVIWQLKRRTAGTDPVELAAAEAWNPAVVTRNVVAAGRHRLEVHRAQRRAAERTQAYTPDPQTHNQQFSDPAETDAR